MNFSQGENREALDIMEAAILNSISDSAKWYYITFKPFDDSYAKLRNWYSVKGIESCASKVKSYKAKGLLTRETEAAKEHINALVCCDQDLTHLHDKVFNHKYKMYAVHAKDHEDRQRLFKYITKEFDARPAIKYKDYICIQ